MNNSLLFKPVWVSTVSHIEKILEIYANASLLDKGFGTYDLPAGFPYAHLYGGLVPIFKAPLIYIASGIMDVGHERIQFQPKSWKVFGSRIRNVRTDLEFDIAADKVISVEAYTVKSLILQYYNIPFTRIHTNQEGLTQDFLVCVGGSGFSMRKIRNKNQTLFLALERLLAAPSN